MKSIIREIEKAFNKYFHDSNFRLTQKRGYKNNYFVTGDILSKAIDNYGNNNREINVLKWFDNFWVYFEIQFQPNKNKFPNIFLSFSIFQGQDKVNAKTQLFRAEWDNYENSSNTHPQPHWHIYPFESYSETGNGRQAAAIFIKSKIQKYWRIGFLEF